MSLPVRAERSYIHVGDVDVGGHSYVCDCCLVCCLCVSLRVYMCTHVCDLYVFCLCVCVSVYTHVCGAHAGDIPPQMRETRVPMLEAPLPLFLYCLPATCATCNSPNTNTNKHIHYIHICIDINTHTHKLSISFYISQWYSSWNKNPKSTSQFGRAQTRCV